jgi:hypothetical protein
MHPQESNNVIPAFTDEFIYNEVIKNIVVKRSRLPGKYRFADLKKAIIKKTDTDEWDIESALLFELGTGVGHLHFRIIIQFKPKFKAWATRYFESDATWFKKPK